MCTPSNMQFTVLSSSQLYSSIPQTPLEKYVSKAQSSQPLGSTGHDMIAKPRPPVSVLKYLTFLDPVLKCLNLKHKRKDKDFFVLEWPVVCTACTSALKLLKTISPRGFATVCASSTRISKLLRNFGQHTKSYLSKAVAVCELEPIRRIKCVQPSICIDGTYSAVAPPPAVLDNYILPNQSMRLDVALLLPPKQLVHYSLPVAETKLG